jgi:hypothetical protein
MANQSRAPTAVHDKTEEQLRAALDAAGERITGTREAVSRARGHVDDLWAIAVEGTWPDTHLIAIRSELREKAMAAAFELLQELRRAELELDALDDKLARVRPTRPLTPAEVASLDAGVDS